MAKSIDGFKLATGALERMTIPVLSHARVMGGRVFATDLDVEIEAPTLRPDGWYTKKGEPLAKGFDEPNGYRMTPAEFKHTYGLGDLSTMLSRGRHAVSTEETRYYLNGVFFEFGATLKLTATDGHRLASYDTPQTLTGPAAPACIVPRKTVDLIIKAGGVRWIMAYQPDRRARFTNELGVVIESKLIDGAYPDYPRVIPKGPFAYTLYGDVKACLPIIKEFAGYGAERSKKMSITGEVLRMTPPDLATLEKTWPVEVKLGVRQVRRTLPGPDFRKVWVDEQATEVQEIGFNARYLREAFEIPGKLGGTFAFAYADAASPALIKFSALPGFTGVAMPLRV